MFKSLQSGNRLQSTLVKPSEVNNSKNVFTYLTDELLSYTSFYNGIDLMIL